MNPATPRIALWCLTAGMLIGCSRAAPSPSTAPSPSKEAAKPYAPRPAGTITFSHDIAPILFARCASCHAPESSGPFPLLTYVEVRSHAQQISDVVERRVMPPWLPDPSFAEFAGQRILSEDEIGLIRQWVSEGAVEGDSAEMPAPPEVTQGWKLGEPDLILEMPVKYTLTAEGSDVFRNFVIPAPVDHELYIRAVEVRPGNPRIVHHGVLLIDTTPESRRQDQRDSEPGYGGMLYGSTAHSPDGHFLGWTPGKSPFVAPAGMAWRLEPGADAVLQLHMLPTGKPETIGARIGLYTTDVPPERTPMMVRLGSLEIDIAPGVADYRIRDEFRLPVDVQVLGVYPHAHYLAKEMTARARLPDGREVPLIRIPQWNFNWQDEYRYSSPIELPAGSTLEMEFSYDNSDGNPVNPHHPPRRVVWGPSSKDEMGDLWVQVLPENTTSLRTLKQAFLKEEFDARLSGFAHAIRINPDDLEAQYNLGSLSEQAGRVTDAEHHYREALRIDPDHPQSLNNLGVLLCQRGEIPDAVPLFERALQILPDYEDARVNLDQARRLAPAQQ